jgi:hypothetical protein
MKRPLTIRVETLPPRARPLTETELSRAYGGCLGAREICGAHSDCCSGACSWHYGSAICKADTTTGGP